MVLVKVYVMLAGLNDASINHDEVAAATSQKATPEEVANERGTEKEKEKALQTLQPHTTHASVVKSITIFAI